MNNKYRTNGITKILVTFFLVLLPGFAIWFFLSKDWTREPILSYRYTWIIAIIFIIITFVITYVIIKLKWAWYDLFNLIFPITVLMMIILVTYPLNDWQRAIIVLPVIIIISLPTNIIVGRITDEVKRRIEEENYE